MNVKNKIFIYDTTLRDGAQAEGISFTVEDKLKIVTKLDSFGIDYIEAGNPGSNPKDLEFFKKVSSVKLNHSKLTAFGSTRRAGTRVDSDPNIQALLSANVNAIAIFGKSWDFHVTDIIRTSLEENLNMISDTIEFFKGHGKEVIFDAEHFFDGYKCNNKYALETLRTAADAKADWIILCDTNGGTLTSEINDIMKEVKRNINVKIGIHCHNDSGVAVANSLAAVENGAVQVQGTINGYGERCGNSDLCAIIPNLQLKMNKSCIPTENIKELTNISRYISEIVNLSHDERSPYVGNSAFAHKGGMHIDAVIKSSYSFEHISPELVGNKRRILMSEVSGRSTILERIKLEAPWITKDSPEVKAIVDKLKQLENEGYQFEGAESSFALIVKRALGKGKEFFKVKDFRVFEDSFQINYCSLSIIRVIVNGMEELAVGEGDGPVNALDTALRKALILFYPSLNKIRLTDYKVRVLDTTEATAAKVRVHIESTDGEKVWGTVGVSSNIIEASLFALIDSIENFLYTNEDS